MNRVNMAKEIDEFVKHLGGSMTDFFAGISTADKCKAFLLTKWFKNPAVVQPKEGQWCVVAFIDHLGWHLRQAQYLSPGWAVPNKHGMSEHGSILGYWAPMDDDGNEEIKYEEDK